MPEVLVEVYRGELIENIYRGDIVLVNEKGKSVLAPGNADKVTYWRSAAKPVQALPVIYSGAADKYGFTEKELALMAASHSGEEQHTKILYSILEKIGLDESALKCGTHPPFHRPTRKALQKKGTAPTEAHNACSGKHAAQLTLCQYFGWDIADYYKAEHPVQKMILKVISEVTDYPEDDIYVGVDGCGVPVFGLPLWKMAYAYSCIANRELLPLKYQKSAQVLFSAMQNHPEVIAGTGRFGTELMKLTGNGLLAKSGADGVFCIAIRGSMGIAVKIEDGSMRPLYAVIVDLLSKLEVLKKEEVKKLAGFHHHIVRDHRGEEVGRFNPVVSGFSFE